MDEASAPALELSPANSGMPLLLASDAIFAADSSQDQASSCGQGLESNGRATHVSQLSRHVPGDTYCRNPDAVKESISGRSREVTLRRYTAEVAALSRDSDHWARRTAGNLPWSSPFEAHAQTVVCDHSSSCTNSTAAAGKNGQEEESGPLHVVGRTNSEPAKPDFSTRQTLKMTPCSHAKQALVGHDAPGSFPPDEGGEGGPACSSRCQRRASLAPACDSVDASFRAETEMVSLASEEHHGHSEEFYQF